MTPDDLRLLVARAAAHEAAGQTHHAEALYALALRVAPDHDGARARLHALGAVPDARPQGAPDQPPKKVVQALVALHNRKRHAEAARRATAALQDWPASGVLWNLLGVALNRTGRTPEAERAFRQAVSLDASLSNGWYNLGNLLASRHDLDEAIAAYQASLEADPRSARTHNNLANALRRAGRPDQAITHYEAALAIDPGRAISVFNLGNALWDQGRLAESTQAYRRAIALRPDYAKAHHNLGNNLRDHGEIREAAEHFGRAFEADPRMTTSLSARIRQEAHMCDWSAWETFAEVAETLGIEGQAVPPFDTFAFEDHPERLLLRTRAYLAAKTRPPRTPWRPPRPAARPRRLKIGYLSADFHDHATMYLLAGVLREHDRERFEIVAISHGTHTSGDMHALARRHVDAFHDVSGERDASITRLCRQLGLDIAVDLKGWTKHSRPQVFVSRVAPVQINYLGYPGSMGSKAWDWILADPIVLPAEQREHYDEAALYLPECYQPNDDARPIADVQSSRSDHGLPEDGTVLACFNKSYKLSPRELDIWARVLEQVDGSVLWLFRANAYVEDNLRAEARARGVDPARLVFGDRLPHHEHLARLRHADLFVDTFAVNAHTTASDALWAGCPVLTLAGEQFAARVAASILHAVGLPELITDTAEDYEALLLELASDRPRLRALRDRLEQTRHETPLFDTVRYTRHLEQAYDLAHAHWRSGEAPADLWVEA